VRRATTFLFTPTAQAVATEKRMVAAVKLGHNRERAFSRCALLHSGGCMTRGRLPEKAVGCVRALSKAKAHHASVSYIVNIILLGDSTTTTSSVLMQKLRIAQSRFTNSK